MKKKNPNKYCSWHDQPYCRFLNLCRSYWDALLIFWIQYLLVETCFSVSPHDVPSMLFKYAKRVRCLHGSPIFTRVIGVHEHGVGWAINQGLERRRRLAEPKLAAIEEGLEVGLLGWVHVRYEELGYVTSIQHSSEFVFFLVVDWRERDNWTYSSVKADMEFPINPATCSQ